MHSWFSARLEGDLKWIEHNRQRIVTICFAPRREGFCEATLELTFCDDNRKADFVIKRMLLGEAKQRIGGQRHWHRENVSAYIPGTRPTNGWVDSDAGVFVDEEDELLDSDGTGISVSHEDGLDFPVVERKRRNGPFKTPSSVLTIGLADGFPAVAFVKATTSDPECVIAVSTFCLCSSPQ